MWETRTVSSVSAKARIQRKGIAVLWRGRIQAKLPTVVVKVPDNRKVGNL